MTNRVHIGSPMLTTARPVLAVLTVLLIAVCLDPGVARAQTVTRGPYLNMGRTNGVTIRWRTNIATNCWVRYGTEQGNLTLSAGNSTVTTEHVIQITGLEVDTKYFYSVGTSTSVLAGGDSLHYFRTSPAPGTGKRTRVWVIGDSGQPGQSQANVYNAYRNHTGATPTNVWLMLGDNAYDAGTDAEYQAAVFDAYKDLLVNTVLWPTRGNHDAIHSGTNNDYYDIFTLPANAQAGGVASGTEAYYSFDFANIHFICLDSEGSNRSPTGDMLTWLVADLADAAADPALEWTIAYWHHPPYTKGSHNSDSSTDSGGRMRDMRQNALPILEAGGVDLVLTGHSHSYERSFLLDGHYGLSTTLHESMKVDDGDGRLFGGDGSYLKPTLGQGAHEGAVYAVVGSSSHRSSGPLNHPVMIASLYELGSMVLDISGDLLEATFIDDAGNILDRFTIIKGMTATQVPDDVPRLATRLDLAYPNPFSDGTRLTYSIPSAGEVRLTIYDVMGRRIRSLVEGSRPPGDHVTVWDGRDAQGGRVAPAVYFGVLEFGGEKRARKLVVVR